MSVVTVINVRMAYCKECQAEIFFAKTPAGKTTPVDVMPSPEGAYILAAENPPQLEKFDAHLHTDKPRYESHYRTCTNPSRFSKRKAGAR